MLIRSCPLYCVPELGYIAYKVDVRRDIPWQLRWSGLPPLYYSDKPIYIVELSVLILIIMLCTSQLLTDIGKYGVFTSNINRYYRHL
jgi:hypothetical protein